MQKNSSEHSSELETCVLVRYIRFVHTPTSRTSACKIQRFPIAIAQKELEGVEK